MMSPSLLKDLLLITNPKVLALANYLNQTALLFILPVFYIGIITELFTNFDFKGVAKRAVIAFLAIKILTPIFVETVDASLKVSSELVRKYSPKNKFLSAYQSAKVDSGDKSGVWNKLTSIVKLLVEDPIVLVIFLLSYIAFFLLTQLYSLTYHLTLAFIGLCAILSILPLTKHSLVGAVKSIFWCALLPFVVAITLCLIGDSDVFFKSYSGGIVQNLESLIQLLIMTVILLMTPLITSKLMSETGISQMAENLGQMAAMSTMVGGASFLSNVISNKAAAIGAAVHNQTTKPVINRMKDSISNKAQMIAKDKGLGPSLKTLSAKSPAEKLKSGFSDFRQDMKATTLKEKVVLGADSVLNKRENSLAKEARNNEVQKFNNGKLTPDYASKREIGGIKTSQSKVSHFTYKNEAGAYLKNQEQLLNQRRDHAAFIGQREIPLRDYKINSNDRIPFESKKMPDRSRGKMPRPITKFKGKFNDSANA